MSTGRTRRFGALLLSFLLTSVALGAPRDASAEAFAPALYDAIEYRLVGPYRGGRSATVTGVPGDRSTYYFGSVGGGVWKTTDGGAKWRNVSDGFFGGSVGAVAVSESDPNVLYVGLGEKTIRGNVSSNFGVWKSTDAGKNWRFIGLEDTRHIGRIRVHPTNPDIVYVAAMGDLWQSSDARGVYKSTDGGETWRRVLFANQDAGAVDLVLQPGNARILYASTWNVRRTPHSLSSGGPGSDLWKSTDAGETWEKLTDLPGLPSAPRGIIGVTVSPANPERVWAIIEAEDGGVFRSDDAGESWKKLNSDRALRSRAWYYTRVIADSQNENRVYVMNVSYGVSEDGGKTFSLHRAPHGDHHDLWIDPEDNARMIIADDGGAQVSTDAGASWTTYHNQPTAQFYRIATDEHFPYRIYGAQQDNSSIRIAHRGSNGAAITERDWEVTAGGESAYHAVDPTNPDVVYGGNYKGYLYRFDHGNGQRRSVNVWPLNPAGSGVEVMKYRFNWNFPTFFSHHDPKRLYAFSHRVHVSTTEGQNWDTISPDLTRAIPETLVSSGGPITQDNTGVEYYATILTANESPLEAGVLWTGSDDGLLHVTRDDGQTWQNVTPRGAPERIMWNSIDVHPTQAGGAYVAGTLYKAGDFTPYLYRTADYGRSWTRITNGIDPLHFTRVVRADPDRAGLLYAGTEYGMYVSFDDGEHWQSFQLNLPEVPITDLQVRDRNLIVATQGRSFWIIDDLSPLHQLENFVAEADFHLFQPKPSYRMRSGRGRRDPLLEGQNHPAGVMFYFNVDGDAREGDGVRLEILEADGTLVKRFASDAEGDEPSLDVDAGANLFVWDMRYPDALSFDGLILYSSNTRGPLAVPGTYRARLSIGNDSVEQTFEILPDPRIDSSIADLQAQFDFLIAVRDKLSEAHQAVIDVRTVRADLDYLEGKLDEAAPQSLREAIALLRHEMTIIENNIHETRNEAYQDPLNFGIKLNNRLAYLATHEAAGDFPPTDQAVAYQAEVSAQIDAEIAALDALFEDRIPDINRLLGVQGVSVLGRP
ncbi:MAG: glycosyl hydrolase [Pseudomonadota bacterium]|nr:glycosyl hydrolase [Pseudomonadota bacterium]